MEKVKSWRHEKNEENYPLGGRGWEKKGNNPCGGSSNVYFKL